jgi:hypothetical protein
MNLTGLGQYSLSMSDFLTDYSCKGRGSHSNFFNMNRLNFKYVTATYPAVG